MKFGKPNTLIYRIKNIGKIFNQWFCWNCILIILLSQIQLQAQAVTSTPTPTLVKKARTDDSFPPISSPIPILYPDPFSTPSSNKSLIIIDPFPTIIINLPTPLSTSTPTPVYDPAVGGITLDTTVLVYSIPNLDRIKG